MGVVCLGSSSGNTRKAASLREGCVLTSMDELVSSLEASRKSKPVHSIKLSDIVLSGLTLRQYTTAVKANPAISELYIAASQLHPAEFPLPKQLQRLEITACSLTDLPHTFECQTLTVANLSDNHLTSVPPALQHSKALERLTLQRNHLTVISPSDFSAFCQLRELDLSSNRISEVNLDFETVRYLEVLVLTGNLVSCLPPSFFMFKHSNLRILRVDDNPLGELSRDIQNFSVLEELCLEKTLISDLPPTLGNLQYLKVLEVPHTRVSNVTPDVMANGVQQILSVLRLQLLVPSKVTGEDDILRLLEAPLETHSVMEVCVQNLELDAPNRLSTQELSAFLEKSSPINVLAITKSNMEELPYYMPTGLHTLDLSENNIKGISHHIRLARELRFLNLNCNQITSFERVLSHNSSLEHLSLANNLISEVSSQCVVGLQSLVTLDLSQNQLGWVSFTLDQLPYLRACNLSYNRLRVLQSSFFAGNPPCLRTLILNHNFLQEVPDSIENLSELEYLELEHNRFPRIPRVLKNLAKLKSVSLKENLIDSSQGVNLNSIEEILRILPQHEEKKPPLRALTRAQPFFDSLVERSLTKVVDRTQINIVLDEESPQVFLRKEQLKTNTFLRKNKYVSSLALLNRLGDPVRKFIM